MRSSILSQFGDSKSFLYNRMQVLSFLYDEGYIFFSSVDTLAYFRYHPDKNANDHKAADMFKEVTFSYNILSDPDKRRQYDSAGFEVVFFVSLNIVCRAR